MEKAAYIKNIRYFVIDAQEMDIINELNQDQFELLEKVHDILSCGDIGMVNMIKTFETFNDFDLARKFWVKGSYKTVENVRYYSDVRKGKGQEMISSFALIDFGDFRVQVCG